MLVPHFLIAPHLVASTDLVLTLAQRLANALKGPLRSAVLVPPKELSLPSFTVSMLWHQRTHDDAAQRWMRDLFVSVAQAT